MKMTCHPASGHAARRHGGFTLVELMVVIALVAIVLALAAPSLTETLSKRRLQGATAELGTDIQYARSEAVQLNRQVRIIFGSNCYTVHTIAATDAASCAALGASAPAPLKSVILPAGTGTLSFTSNNGKSFIEFSPALGAATDAAGADSSGYVDVTGGGHTLRVDVTAIGRVRSCSPGGAAFGLPAC